MSNVGADIFLILLRPTRVPVVGEAVSHLFQGQVLIESLSWNLHNEDELKRAEVREEMHRDAESLISKTNDMSEPVGRFEKDIKSARSALKRGMQKATTDEQRSALQDKFDKMLDRPLEKLMGDIETMGQLNEEINTAKGFHERLAEKYAEGSGRNRNFEFTFTKRVDIASTQMLNSMKAGDIFPSGTLTIHKRSSTMMDGTSLVFTIQKIRLLDYELEVSVTDTMTEMMEKWTCEFGSLAYVYKNPPSHYSHGNAGQAAIKTATQNTMRAFTMKNIGSPI